MGDGSAIILAIMVIAVWVGISMIIANWASEKGHSYGAWFAVSFLLSPILAALVLLVLPTKPGEGNKEKYRKCPQCADTVLAEAKICKHCRSELPELLSGHADVPRVP
jgi:hypothetical protein